MLADSPLTDGGTISYALCERSLESEGEEAKPPIQSRLSQESKEPDASSSRHRHGDIEGLVPRLCDKRVPWKRIRWRFVKLPVYNDKRIANSVIWFEGEPGVSPAIPSAAVEIEFGINAFRTNLPTGADCLSWEAAQIQLQPPVAFPTGPQCSSAPR
jgi:hypothetical protein